MCRSDRGNSRRAAVLVFTLVSLAVLLGFAALAIDVGHAYSVKADLQKAADASALAAVTQVGDYPELSDLAQYYADANHPAAGNILDDPDLRVGRWSGKTRSFTGATTPENAVMVTLRRAKSNGNQLPTFFAALLGAPHVDVHATAIALMGGGRCAGVWGLQDITGDGNVMTDSYRSDDAFYGFGNIYANGDLCSNQDIELAGDVDIMGDAMYGPGYALLTSGWSYQIAGQIRELCCQHPAPEIDMAGAQASNDNASIGLTDRGRDPFPTGPWDLVVTGNNRLTLSGGKYYFSSVIIDGQAVVTVTGPTEMYISGPAEFTGGGLVNATEIPANLIIYSKGPSMILSGNAGFHGAVVAPNTEVSLVGTGDYYGSLLGQIIDIDGTATIHVDETLIGDLFGMDVTAPVLVH